MIPANLKVGDKFVDGERTYKVLEIVPEGYISEACEDTEVVVEEKATEEKPTATRGRRKKV